MKKNKNNLCPVCETHNVIKEKINNTSDKHSYLCIKCGYTTTDDYTTDSSILNKQLETMSNSIIDLQFFDENTGLHWFPSVFIQTHGLLFPEHSGKHDKNFKWVYIPIEKINKEDKNIPENYDTKVAYEKREYFDKLDFFDALKRFGSIESEVKLSND